MNQDLSLNGTYTSLYQGAAQAYDPPADGAFHVLQTPLTKRGVPRAPCQAPPKLRKSSSRAPWPWRGAGLSSHPPPGTPAAAAKTLLPQLAAGATNHLTAPKDSELQAVTLPSSARHGMALTRKR